MVQDQLVDYISSQIKLGVSRDAIKSALVSAGWVAGDVEDTLKKIEGGASGAAAGGAAGMVAAGAMGKAAGAGAGTMAGKSSDSQMIRVSDLVSASPASGSSSASSMSSSAPTQASNSSVSTKTKDQAFSGKISGNSFEAMPAGGSSGMSSDGSSKKTLIGGIVAVVLILGLGGLAWYFYSANGGLASQVAALTSQSASVNTELTSLKSQLDASTTDLTTQIATLTSANTDLALNLSFYAVPLGGPTSTATTALPVTISGSLALGAKGLYMITTPRGAKIVIVNSVAADIAPQLRSDIGDTIQIVGTYIPGSDQVTATSVTDLSPHPAPTPTSTPAAATSTMTAASSTGH